MNYLELEDLPVDIFELISTYLDYHDIANLEKTSKKFLLNIQKLNLWRKVALTLMKNFDAPAPAVKYATMCSEGCKILIGVTEHTKKIVEELKKSVASYERMRHRKKERFLQRYSCVGNLPFTHILYVDTKIIARKKYVLKQILHDYYVKTLALEMDIAMKVRANGCAGLNMVTLDVKNHIDQYKRQICLLRSQLLLEMVDLL